MRGKEFGLQSGFIPVTYFSVPRMRRRVSRRIVSWVQREQQKSMRRNPKQRRGRLGGSA